jgi:hypothetical protein
MAYTNSKLVTYTNLTKKHGGLRNHKIDTITIHIIVGQWTAKQGCDYFATTDRTVSANYVVGKDGSIGLSVEEKNRSYCSSSSSNDNRAITIEVASDTYEPYAVTDKAYNALIDLVTDICKRNGIKELKWKADKSLIGQVDKQNMTVHRWFSPDKSCPGTYLYNKHSQIAAEVNKRLGETNKPKVKYTVVIGEYNIKEQALAARDKAISAGFKDAKIVTSTETVTETVKETELSVGDNVTLKENAPVYGETRKFSAWVYRVDLYVREISGNRVVISTQKTGDITGAVDKKYLTKK